MLIELFLGYLSTLAISLSLNIYEEMKLRKELCDNNYRFKLDYNSNEYFNEFINSNNRFIPVVNVCEALIDLKEYNDNKNYYLNNLLFMNVLEKMSIYEEAEYNKYRSLFNAYFLERKMNKKRYNSSYVDYYDGKIFFDFDRETSLKVIDSTGSISRQSNDNQLYILLNSLEENVNSREEELTMEELKNELEEIKASKEYIQKYKEYLEKNNKVSLLLVKHK